MAIKTSDVVPLSQARSRLSEIADEAKAGAEKIITRNGESYVALIDAGQRVSASPASVNSSAPSRRIGRSVFAFTPDARQPFE